MATSRSDHFVLTPPVRWVTSVDFIVSTQLESRGRSDVPEGGGCISGCNGLNDGYNMFSTFEGQPVFLIISLIGAVMKNADRVRFRSTLLAFVMIFTCVVGVKELKHKLCRMRFDPLLFKAKKININNSSLFQRILL